MVHFHRRSGGEYEDKLKLNATLTLSDGYIVKLKKEMKFLGVYLDPKLTFKTHREMMSAKATSAINAMQALAGSN